MFWQHPASYGSCPPKQRARETRENELTNLQSNICHENEPAPVPGDASDQLVREDWGVTQGNSEICVGKLEDFVLDALLFQPPVDHCQGWSNNPIVMKEYYGIWRTDLRAEVKIGQHGGFGVFTINKAKVRRFRN